MTTWRYSTFHFNAFYVLCYVCYPVTRISYDLCLTDCKLLFNLTTLALNESTTLSNQVLLGQVTTCLVLKSSPSWTHLSVKHFRKTLHSCAMEFQNQAGLPQNFTPETWFLEIWDEKLNLKQLLLQHEHVNFCQQSRTKLSPVLSPSSETSCISSTVNPH